MTAPWRRIAPGHYTATFMTPIVRPDGARKVVPVKFYIQHVPEWCGPEKWAVVSEDTDGRQLTQLSDIIAATYREAKEYAEYAAKVGYKWYSPLSTYCSAGT